MPYRTLQMAWRNLGRNKKRTGLALLAIGVGQFALLATNGLMRGYTDNIRKAITGPMIGNVQIHAKGWRQERAIDLTLGGVGRLTAELQADPDIQSAAARIYAPVLVAPKQEAFIATVVGLDVAVESQPYGLLSGLAEPLQPGHVLLGYRLAERIGAGPGQEIALVGQASDGSLANDLYKVQGLIRCPADLINQSGIVMALADAQAFFVLPDQANEIVVRSRADVSSPALAGRLARRPALAGKEVLAWQQLVPELVTVLRSSDFVGYFVLGLVFIAAVAGIANTLMMSIFERLHELGMLLALGCRPLRIVRMILVEAVLAALLGVAVGTVVGYGFEAATAQNGINMASWGGNQEAASEIAFKGLNLPLHVYPRLEPWDSLFGLIAVIATSLVAAVWPSWIAARLEPMEAMRA